MLRRGKSLQVRLSQLRRMDNGCLIWTGGTDRNGYGRLMENYKRYIAHRYFYIKLVGNISSDIDLHHKCRNILCCNVEHLEPKPWLQHRTEEHPKERRCIDRWII